MYPVATDSIFAGRFRSKLFSSLGVVAKKKGVGDFRSAAAMREIINEKGSLLIFPEGNRTYCEFQFYIARNLTALLKKFKATVVLFNLNGGTGKSPRFKNKNRKGKFTGRIKRVLRYEEYSLMKDDELLDLIKDELKVFDSDSSEKYKSNKRAEYLERIFFVCPVCKKTETVYSKGKYVFCRNCGALAEYTEDIHLKSENSAFPFTRVIDYWNYQKKYVSDLKIKKGERIFSDKRVKVMLANPYRARKTLYKGDIFLDDEYLYCGERKFDVKNIETASVVSGRNLTFSYGGNDYFLRGDKRFNPLKYAFIFHKLDTKMRQTGADPYYNLQEN